MWLFKKLREIEWIASLWGMATTSPLFWLVVGAVGTMLTAIGAIAYDWAAWINSYGRPGWIIAATAALFVCCLVTGTVAWTWQQIRGIRSRHDSSGADSAAQEKRASSVHETLRRIERSVFLLLASATDEGTYRALWKALKTLPGEENGDTTDTALSIHARLEAHESATAVALRGTRWWQDFSSTMAAAERDVDIELRTADTPNGVRPMAYRAYAIAIRKRGELKTFLERAIAETDFERDHVLGMLREQKALHEKH
jgi:hypothetical protein